MHKWAAFGIALLASGSIHAQTLEAIELDSLSGTRPVKVPVDILWPSGNGPFPAMVQVHGSGGPNITLLRNYYGKMLTDMGVAVTISNHFVGRGVKSTVQGQGAVAHTEMMLDAFKILEYLSKHPKIDPKRIGIFGYSKGGTVAFYTAFEEMADWLSPKGPRFALHVPFYPGCVNSNHRVKTTGAPILVLMGADDDWANPKTCMRMVDKVKAAGSPIEAIIYQGAMHSWDSAWDAYSDPKGENYFNCILDEQADGSIVELRTGIQTNAKGGAVIARNLDAAMKGCRTYGIRGGPNRAVRDQSSKALRDIIRSAFRLN